MQLKALLTDDDRAVSPVIGVILMVAITVILAAVIASFVLGLGDTTQTTPQASFNFDYDEGTSDELTIVHESGDTLDGANVDLVVNDAQDGSSTLTYDGSLMSGEISAGFSETLMNDNGQWDDSDFDLDLSEATVKVTWTGSSGDNSATLGDWEGPDA